MDDQRLFQGPGNIQLRGESLPLHDIIRISFLIKPGLTNGNNFFIAGRGDDLIKPVFPGICIHMPGVKSQGDENRQIKLVLLIRENIQYQGCFGVLVIGVGMNIDVVQNVVSCWLLVDS